jgi:hypothetical protein
MAIGANRLNWIDRGLRQRRRNHVIGRGETEQSGFASAEFSKAEESGRAAFERQKLAEAILRRMAPRRR